MSDQKPILTPAVKALGFVSLFTDISSEMVYPLNPIFITSVLNAPVWSISRRSNTRTGDAVDVPIALILTFCGRFDPVTVT